MGASTKCFLGDTLGVRYDLISLVIQICVLSGEVVLCSKVPTGWGMCETIVSGLSLLEASSLEPGSYLYLSSSKNWFLSVLF